MKISIAMATYNGEKYIQEQLQSFVYQERRPDELIVCDDDSSDDTMQILERFARTAPFEVRIFINHENLGYVRTFEKAMSQCQGDLIFLSDQDDVWYSRKIARMEAYMRQHTDVMLATADMDLGNMNSLPSGATQLQNLRALGQDPNFYYAWGCATVVRREWLKVALPIDELFAHDGWMGCLASALQSNLIIDEPLQIFRRHGANVTADSLTSRPRKVSKWDAVKEYRFSKTSSQWQIRRDQVLAAQFRLNSRKEQIAALRLSHKLATALESLQCRACALNNRIHAVSQPRLKRFPSIIRMWIRGEYRYFSGWPSLFKDIVRPRDVC